MGAVLNNHTRPRPLERALAESVAATRARALAQVIQGLSGFDESGKYFWEGDRAAASQSTTIAFSLLRGARDDLLDLQDKEVQLAADSGDNPKLNAGRRMGIVPDTAGALMQVTTGDRRIVAMIDHLLLVEATAVAGIDSNDFQPYYQAISSPARHLLEDVLKHLQTVLEFSRLTHEWSDVVMREVNREEHRDPHEEFVGPVAAHQFDLPA